MAMTNLGELVAAVQRNCHISDARHAGDYTLCVFLLKMREFYRWEYDIPLTRPLPKDEVGDWLEQREHLWEGLESSAFESLPVAGANIDPFDADTINRELVPQGYVYSGGYGRYGKACFFLGALQRTETHDGCRVLVSSCEYARELSAPPAMLLGRTVYVRLESVRRFLWEKIEESSWGHGRETMERALSAYGFERDAEAALTRMTEAESRVMVLHELGEVRAGEQLGPRWEALLLGLTRSRAEIMTRAVRDIVADGLVTLPALIEQDNWPSLHFYFANFGGMRKHLYPELARAYPRAVETGSTAPLRERVTADTPRWLDTAQRMLALAAEPHPDLDGAIEQLLTDDHAEKTCRQRG
jgi:hypothetical protein